MGISIARTLLHGKKRNFAQTPKLKDHRNKKKKKKYSSCRVKRGKDKGWKKTVRKNHKVATLLSTEGKRRRYSPS